MAEPRPRNPRPPDRRILALLAAALAAAIVISFSVGTDDDGNPQATITVTAKNHRGKTVEVETPKAAVDAAAKSPELTEDLSDRSPAAKLVTPADRRASDKAADDSAPRIKGPVPLAAPLQRGCLTRRLPTNYGYRSGMRPSIGVAHLPVAYNKPGWVDVNSVWTYFSYRSTSASSNYLNDADGNCIYAVPETLKAYAQAGLNSATACSVEQQAYGTEGRFMNPAGLHQLAVIFHDCFRRWGIPLRRCLVSAGRVLRSGLCDHRSLGAAGGGHQDIRRFGAGCRAAGVFADSTKCVDQIILAARAIDSPRIAARWHSRCRRLTATRAKIAARQHVSTRERRKAHEIRTVLRRGGYRCDVSRAQRRS